MPSKQNISYHLLQGAGLMIKVNEKLDGLVKARIPPRKGETFKQWKARVFGNHQIDVEVYSLYAPPPQTRMSTLIRDGGGSYIKQMINLFGRHKDVLLQEGVEQAKDDVTELFSTYPAEILQQILDDHRANLHPAAHEFIKGLIVDEGGKLSSEVVLERLVLAYSHALNR
jgi:hypothetical protein